MHPSTPESTDNYFTVLFMGKTGVGKSSTLNCLFNLNSQTHHSIACTKKPLIFFVNDQERDTNADFLKLRIVDMPGIGESILADNEYMSFYTEWIPYADSLVWVTQADTRAYKRDQLFISELLPFVSSGVNFTLALNKIDCLATDADQEGFDFAIHTPSGDQLTNLSEKIDDIYIVFKEVLGENIEFTTTNIIPYTSSFGWGINALKHKVLTGRKTDARN
jgi:predicted GTPase